MQSQFTQEIQTGHRFEFGKNWRRFILTLTEDRIEAATYSLKKLLDIDSLQGKTFLDIGSGSGLHSLAARRLGAKVHSFDYDPESVTCTHELKKRYFPDDEDWVIEKASVLDKDYLKELGQFDFVYSWGVLHHTGGMYNSFNNIIATVAPTGKLILSIYNNQAWVSKYWLLVKRIYNKSRIGKFAMISVHATYLFGLRYLFRAITGRLFIERGMSMWYDMIDWLGGYPFEVAKPEDVFSFFRDRGFVLDKLKTCGGRMGCNEFMFHKEKP